MTWRNEYDHQPKPPHTRVAELRRAEGKRSRYMRCPCCRKLRLKRLEANWLFKERILWSRTPFGLVCHVCVVRHNYAGFELVDGEATPLHREYSLEIRRKLGAVGTLVSPLSWNDSEDASPL